MRPTVRLILSLSKKFLRGMAVIFRHARRIVQLRIEQKEFFKQALRRQIGFHLVDRAFHADVADAVSSSSRCKTALTSLASSGPDSAVQ